MGHIFDQIEIDEYESLEPEEKERFRIKDLESASWAFRKISAFHRKQAEMEDLAQKEVERITVWKNKELARVENSIGFFESLLISFYREQKKLDARYKLSTPYGKVTSRKQGDVWELKPDILMKWLKENSLERLVRVKEEPNLAELKRQLKTMGHNAINETGEIIPGIYITEQAEKYSVKVEGD